MKSDLNFSDEVISINFTQDQLQYVAGLIQNISSDFVERKKLYNFKCNNFLFIDPDKIINR